jgi:hypothetical protein
MQRENYRGALWIDAISINQDDLTERSQQVAITGRIYSTALKVHVWLGPATSNDLVVQAMRELRAINWKSMCKTQPYETSVDLWDRSKEHEPMDHFQSCTDYFFDSMLQLQWIDYWDRIWTIQEFVLAREIELRCGPEILDGETLVWYEWARHETYRSQPEFHPDCKAEDLSKKATVLLPSVAMRTVHHRAKRLHCEDPDSWKEEIDDLIHKYQKSRCANCLDHVYALLPLSISRHLIVPDYCKSKWDLFHDVGRIVSNRRNEPEYIQWRNPAQWRGRLKYDFKLFL